MKQLVEQGQKTLRREDIRAQSGKSRLFFRISAPLLQVENLVDLRGFNRGCAIDLAPDQRKADHHRTSCGCYAG